MAYFPPEAAASILPGSFTLANLPPAADNLDKYVRVSDLFGVKRDLLLASSVGSFAFWQPVRPNFMTRLAVTKDETLLPLGVGDIVRLSGTIALGTTRNISLSTDGAWPGAEKEIMFGGSLLGTLNILGTGLGSAVMVALGVRKKFVCELSGGAPAWDVLP